VTILPSHGLSYHGAAERSGGSDHEGAIRRE